MVKVIDDIEFIVTDTHLEARLLECGLIKSIRPVFNSQMKHDRGYVYLKLEDYNQYRALSIVESRGENTFTFGPFRSKSQLNETLNVLKNLYPIKSIDRAYSFDYHLFPAILDEDDFNENRNSLYGILTDNSKAKMFIKELSNKMKSEASLYNFEMAAIYKEIIINVNYIIYSINKNYELANRDLIASIPVENGYKVFYISKGMILKKEISENSFPGNIEAFTEADLPTLDSVIHMDEKSLVDYKDIVCSEIISSSEIVVKYI